MIETVVSLVEHITVAVRDSCTPSYANNTLTYFVPVQRCPKKRYYRDVKNDDGKWLIDVKSNLNRCGYEFTGRREDLISSDLEIKSFYAVPQNKLNCYYTCKELESYKMRLVRINIPPSFIEQNTSLASTNHEQADKDQRKRTYQSW